MVSCREFYIRSDRDMLSSISSVRPGDTIHLGSDAVYFLQNVELTRSGLASFPITLTGGKNTRISSDGTALTLRGSYWRIQNLNVENSQMGIVVTGNNNTLKGLSFHNVEEEALSLRGNGNLVNNCVFNGANNGIIVSGKGNSIMKNSITSLVASVSATPRSCCGRVEDNTLNGLLSVHGSDYSIVKNVANSDVTIAGPRNEVKVNVINGKLDVPGCSNSFFGNTAVSSEFTTTCYNWDDGKNKFGKGESNKLLIVNYDTNPKGFV